MELRTLKTFIKVAELLNFSKAAEALGYTQSTVSVHIGQLETELHTRLFERFGKNVRLTAEGLSFLYYAERIIEAEREAANYMLHHMEPHGTLIIGAVDSINCYLLPPLLLKYHEQYPGVNVIIKTASMEILFEWLEHNEIDLACVLNENLYSNKYIKIFEAKTPVRFIVNVSHPLADHPHISLDSLTSQDFILTEKDIGYRRDLDIRLSQYERHVEPFFGNRRRRSHSALHPAQQCCHLSPGICGIPTVAGWFPARSAGGRDFFERVDPFSVFEKKVGDSANARLRRADPGAGTVAGVGRSGCAQTLPRQARETISPQLLIMCSSQNQEEENPMKPM